MKDENNTEWLCEICGKSFKARNNLRKHVQNMHSGSTFECADCGRIFKQRNHIRGHMKIHLRAFDPNPVTYYKCSRCPKKFRDKENRARHVRLSHDPSQDPRCEKCGVQLSCKANLLRHLKTQHPEMCEIDSHIKVPEVFECPTCQRVFKRKDSLRRHNNLQHSDSASRIQYTCDHCSRAFSAKNTLITHINGCRMKFAGKLTFKCLCCDSAFCNEHLINQHYLQKHDVKFIHENLEFQSFANFKDWRRYLEESAASQFVCESGWKTRTHSTKLYKCHRSGLRLGVPDENRKRFPKLAGSKKLDGVCPAQIIMRENLEDGTCSVQFQKTHVGHNVWDKSELWFKRLSKEEALRNKRGRKPGQTKEEFENERRSKSRVGSERELRKRRTRSQSSRIAYSNKLQNRTLSNAAMLVQKDLKDEDSEKVLRDNDYVSNMTAVTSAEVKILVPFNEAESIYSFVKAHEDSILFFKGEGQRDSVNGLEDSDVVIVYMDKFQKEMLHRYSHECVAFDLTYSQSNLHLHTMLIRNHEWEGIGVAFLLSNRAGQMITDIFLNVIERSVGTLSPIIGLGDMSMTYQNAWTEKTIKPSYIFFCSWYVNKQWEYHLNKIANKEKRKVLSRRLYNMAQELDFDTFEKELHSLLSEKDPDLDEFISYFESYCAYTPQFWAYCYRPVSGINTNMSLASLYQIMRCELAEDEKIGSLYECLKTLKKYSTLKEEQLEREKQRGQIYDFEKAAKLHKRHWLAERGGNISVVPVNAMTWTIHSKESDGCIKNYVVQKLDDTDECKICDENLGLLRCSRCKICFHQFICTCLDCSMRCNMCKHIHALGLYLKEQTSVTIHEEAKDEPMVETDECVEFENESETENISTQAYVVEEVILSDDNVDYDIEDIPIVNLDTKKEQLVQEIVSCIYEIQNEQSIDDLKNLWRKSLSSVVETSENKSAQQLFIQHEGIITNEKDVKPNNMKKIIYS